MNIRVQPTPKPDPIPQEDPWYYGWRYVEQIDPDGKAKRVQVPLTEEDVLHPQEDDFIVQNEDHDEDCYYLRTVLTAHLADQPGLHVFHDMRMDWGVASIEPHGPDIAVIANVPAERPFQMGTLHLAEVSARPLLVIEVTSPSTREGDLDDKVLEYSQVGVPFYAIVDRRLHAGREEIRLLAYRATPEGYVRVKLDAQGWLALEPIGLWLGIEGRHIVCRNAQGQRLLNYQEVTHAYRDAEARAQAEAQARQAEAQARQRAEERLLQLEAELNRLRGQS